MSTRTKKQRFYNNLKLNVAPNLVFLKNIHCMDCLYLCESNKKGYLT